MAAVTLAGDRGPVATLLTAGGLAGAQEADVRDRRFPGGRRLAALFRRHGGGPLAHDSAHSSDPGQVPAAGWLGASRARLPRLRPAELADVLEGLSGPGRLELLASLDIEVAADALEEMASGELAALLREAGPAQAARLVAAMEPDEAVDALRGLPPAERSGLLDRMPRQTRLELGSLLGYPRGQAGGIMTTVLACAYPVRRWSRSGAGSPGRPGTGPRSTRWPCSMSPAGWPVTFPPSTCWSATAAGAWPT